MRRAFTLIELLVVIAIVAVLVALALPTLARGKAAAKNAECLSDLHEIGKYVGVYMAEQKMTYPNYTGWVIEDGLEWCPVVGPYEWVSPALGGRRLSGNAAELLAKGDLARDGDGRHGLRLGEDCIASPSSPQWLRSWRNWLRLDGSVGQRKGPLSTTEDCMV